jgi:hypothetical protein
VCWAERRHSRDDSHAAKTASRPGDNSGGRRTGAGVIASATSEASCIQLKDRLGSRLRRRIRPLTGHCCARRPGEPANAELKSWKVLRKIHSNLSQATTLIKAVQTLILVGWWTEEDSLLGPPQWRSTQGHRGGAEQGMIKDRTQSSYAQTTGRTPGVHQSQR